MKIDLVPIICVVFLTLFLLVVVPITKTPKGDIEMKISPVTDSVTTGNVMVKTNAIGETTTTIQH
jgi:hypothetical protein